MSLQPVKVALLAGAAVIGVGALAYGLVAPAAMRSAVAAWLAANPEVHVGKFKVDAWTREIKLEGVSLQDGGNTLGAGSVVVTCPLSQLLPAVLSSWRNFAADAAVNDFSGTVGDVSVSAPSIVIDRVSYDAGSTSDPVAALAGISAESIAIPDLSYRYTATAIAAAIVAAGDLKAIGASGLVHGKIAGLTAGAMQVAITGPAPETVTVGSFQQSNIDLPAYYRFYTQSGDPSAPFARIADGGTMSNLGLAATNRGVSVQITIGTITMGPFDARPMKIPYIALVRLLRSDPSHAMPMLGDMLNSVRYTSYDADDIAFSATAANRAAQNFTIRHAGVKNLGGGGIGSLSFDGLSGDSRRGRFDLQKFELDQIDLSPTLAGLQNYALGPEATAGGSRLDRILNLAPTIGHLEIDGVAIKSPDGTTQDALGSFTIDSAGFVRGIPSHAALKMADLLITPPGESMGAVALRGLGYGAVDLSAGFTVDWNQNRGDITVTGGSFTMNDGFALALAGSLHGITRDQAMAGDFSAATFSSADIKLSNGGVIDKAMDYLSQRLGGSRSAAVATVTAGSNARITSLLGDGPLAQSAQTATTQFLRDPKNLEISTNAPQPLALGDWKSADWAVKADQ